MTTQWQPLPTEKTPDIEQMLFQLYGKNRREVILNKECMGCDLDSAIIEGSFRDDQSLAEYHISGLCQSCQDSVFGGTEK